MAIFIGNNWKSITLQDSVHIHHTWNQATVKVCSRKENSCKMVQEQEELYIGTKLEQDLICYTKCLQMF